jgi:replicative DNA helicase
MADPLLRAEEALLGAVLLDPGQLDRLAWLHPGDFYRPAHAALFSAARSAERPSGPGPVPVGWPNRILAEAATRTRGLGASHLHALVGACPHAHHAPVYGRMVLEGAIHRSVLQHATRLHQAVRGARVRGDASQAVGSAEVFSLHLDAAARRWGSTPRTTAPAPAPAPATMQESAPAEMQPGSRSGKLATAERDLLAVFVHRPEERAEVPWLTAEDFVTGYGALLRCVDALLHRGEPVDSLTLTWEARRRGLLATADGTRLVEALVEGVGAGGADWLGEQVVRSALLRALDGAAETIQELARDGRCPPGRLIQHSHRALDAVADVRERWIHASTGRPPAPKAPARPQGGAAQVHAARARSHPLSTPSGIPPRPPRTEGPTR